MRALIDTHILLWWLAGDDRLDAVHRSAIADPENEMVVSAVTIAEISIKASIGKLDVPDGVSRTVESEGFASLPFTVAHAEALRELPWHHRDPFDRMLIAQAITEQIPLVTVDSRIRGYDVECL